MINFDKNATTGTNAEVWEEMKKYALEQYGNPSALYPFAEESRKAIANAQERIAALIHCQPNEIYFLSNGSMADNWVLNSVCRNGSFVITSSIEHHAILNTLIALRDKNVRTLYLPVDINGKIDFRKLEQHIDVADLVSIMYVNNEIGSVQDIESIGHLCRKYNVPFHTDAVQAFGKVLIDVDSQCIDYMSVSGHKFHGPQGIGFLYIREKYKKLIQPLAYGGMQQRGVIAGTENIAGIMGLAFAAEKAYENLKNNSDIVHDIYWTLRSQLKIALPLITYNSNSPLENCLNVCFLPYKIAGEELLAFLGEQDICVSAGSACASQLKEPSHVLRALGLSKEAANSSIRLSFDAENTVSEAMQVVNAITQGVKMLNNR